VAVVAAALVAVVPREPAVPVQARRGLAQLPVPADLVLGPAVPVPALPHPQREPAAPLLAQLAVVVHRVVEPAVAVALLLSPQSSSAAMARSST
jgi:hypothetical protein